MAATRSAGWSDEAGAEHVRAGREPVELLYVLTALRRELVDTPVDSSHFPNLLQVVNHYLGVAEEMLGE